MCITTGYRLCCIISYNNSLSVLFKFCILLVVTGYNRLHDFFLHHILC